MKKILMIIGGIFLSVVVLAIIIFFIISMTSKKLVCKSPEGNITIMYNGKTVTGYIAKNMSYNLDEQKEYAKTVGIEAYLEEFKIWFQTNTSGTCK